MEPTPRRTRSSSRTLLRYAPFVGLVLVVALVWLLFGRSDNSSSSTPPPTAGGPANGPVVFSSANKNTVKWGPKCDTQSRHRRGPADVRAAVREAVHRQQRRRDRAGSHR